MLQEAICEVVLLSYALPLYLTHHSLQQSISRNGPKSPFYSSRFKSDMAALCHHRLSQSNEKFLLIDRNTMTNVTKNFRKNKSKTIHWQFPQFTLKYYYCYYK